MTSSIIIILLLFCVILYDMVQYNQLLKRYNKQQQEQLNERADKETNAE